MRSRRSIFNSHAMVNFYHPADQNLTATASHGSLFEQGTGSSDRSIGGLACKLSVNLTRGPNRSLVRSADRDLQDKNLVSSPDRFAKTADSREWILTHV